MKIKPLHLLTFIVMPVLACKKTAALDSSAQAAEAKTASAEQALLATATYYVSPNGNDANSGTSTTAPWKTLAKVNSFTFSPGNLILLKSGGVWNETLAPKGSGSVGSPIVIDKYDGTARPVINGGGKINGSSTVLLNKLSYWEINNLEVTNTVPAGATYSVIGIKVVGGAATESAINSVAIKNCYVHDVNSAIDGQTNFNKGSGGIILDGKIYDGLVQSCRIANCAVEGLRTTGSREMAARSKNIIFENNLIENIYGDGIVISGVTGGSKAIHNTVYNACMNTGPQNYAGIWTIGSINTQIAYNEVYGMKGGGANDGVAFDADGYDAPSTTDGDVFEYNYTHDNNGGFFLFMNSSKNITVRYNVSVNDVGTTGQKKLFLIENSSNTSRYIYNNVFYLTNPVSKIFWVATIGTFSNNIFYAASSVSTLCDAAVTDKAKFYNNCFFPSTTFSSLNWGSSVRSNNFNTNPSFINPATGAGFGVAGGYNVSSASPCRNAGIAVSNNGGKDFSGNPLPAGNPDVGAFQHAVMANAGSNLADASVRNGSYAGTNFGSAQLLEVKADAVSYARKGYIKFDFTAVNAAKVSSAYLTVYSNGTGATSQVTVYRTTTKSWTESLINWNNAPMDTTRIGQVSVGTAAANYNIDVTNAINQELAAGSKTVSLLLINNGPANAQGYISFNSKEAAANKPSLQITY